MSPFCPGFILNLLTTCGCFMVLYHTVSFWMGVITSLVLVMWCLFLLFPDQKHTHDWDCIKTGLLFSFISAIGCGLSCLVISVILNDYSTIVCTFKECCADSWITPNITGLSFLLHESVFGQHVAVGTIIKLLRGHLETSSSKPLLLSLHGPSGTGKSYVTKLIIENLYHQGQESQFVHFISPVTDILSMEDTDTYKVKLKSQIEESVKRCSRSMFVFDTVDDMPAGVLDILHPFLDYNNQVNGVDYRKAIFIFLSKTGSSDIIHGAITSKKKGIQRRQLSLMDFEQMITNVAYESSSGLYKSSLISSNLISAFVPFLPLERTHVQQCIAQELMTKDIYKFDHQTDVEEVRIIADQLHYMPDSGFSVSGCKGVIEKINLVSRDE
ncbi:Torsin-1B [Mactra antiquata]